MANRNINSLKRWRTIWGVLTLISLAFICLALANGAAAFTKTTEGTTSDATVAGAAIGAGGYSIVVICVGAIPFLLFLVFYLRAGGAVRSEQQHQEMLDAVKGKNTE